MIRGSGTLSMIFLAVVLVGAAGCQGTSNPRDAIAHRLGTPRSLSAWEPSLRTLAARRELESIRLEIVGHDAYQLVARDRLAEQRLSQLLALELEPAQPATGTATVNVAEVLGNVGTRVNARSDGTDFVRTLPPRSIYLQLRGDLQIPDQGWVEGHLDKIARIMAAPGIHGLNTVGAPHGGCFPEPIDIGQLPDAPTHVSESSIANHTIFESFGGGRFVAITQDATSGYSLVLDLRGDEQCELTFKGMLEIEGMVEAVRWTGGDAFGVGWRTTDEAMGTTSEWRTWDRGSPPSHSVSDADAAPVSL